MIKKTFYPLLSALACVAAMTLAPVQAEQVSCGDSDMTASSCSGPFKHSPKAGDTVSYGGSNYGYFGAIKTPGGKDAGTLEFAEIDGPFLLGIEVGSMYSLYFFDEGAEGIKSVDFDTWGVDKTGNDKPRNVTGAFLLTPLSQPPVLPVGGNGDEIVTAPPTAQQVPEPATGALAVLALAAAGLAARRRRRR